MWHTVAMTRDAHDALELWLAEMNRRVLAGRPIARRELAALEGAYLQVTDRCGPPGCRPSPREDVRSGSPQQLRAHRPTTTTIH